MEDAFWSRSYFIATTGQVTLDILKRYVRVKMQLVKKIRIYPTKEQVDVLWEISDKCRIVYNFALNDRQDALEKEARSIKYTEQQITSRFQKRNPEFKSVYSKTYQGILKKLK